MVEITVTAKLENLKTVIDFIKEQLAQVGCSTKGIREVVVAAEEIFVNITSYAYNPHEGPATIRCQVGGEPLQITIGFVDQGIPYNPLLKKDPRIDLPAKERAVGGLGIFMTKKLMDTVTYDFLDGKNVLTISKKVLI